MSKRLTADDVPDMLALVERTEPGPFGPRTIELGEYFGIRDGDGATDRDGGRAHVPVAVPRDQRGLH